MISLKRKIKSAQRRIAKEEKKRAEINEIVRRQRGPWRKVVGVETYYLTRVPSAGSSCLLTLECGHQTGQKGSTPVPKKKCCFQCTFGDKP